MIVYHEIKGFWCACAFAVRIGVCKPKTQMGKKGVVVEKQKIGKPRGRVLADSHPARAQPDQHPKTPEQNTPKNNNRTKEVGLEKNNSRAQKARCFSRRCSGMLDTNNLQSLDEYENMDNGIHVWAVETWKIVKQRMEDKFCLLRNYELCESCRSKKKVSNADASLALGSGCQTSWADEAPWLHHLASAPWSVSSEVVLENQSHCFFVVLLFRPGTSLQNQSVHKFLSRLAWLWLLQVCSDTFQMWGSKFISGIPALFPSLLWTSLQLEGSGVHFLSACGISVSTTTSSFFVVFFQGVSNWSTVIILVPLIGPETLQKKGVLGVHLWHSVMRETAVQNRRGLLQDFCHNCSDMFGSQWCLGTWVRRWVWRFPS